MRPANSRCSSEYVGGPDDTHLRGRDIRCQHSTSSQHIVYAVHYDVDSVVEIVVARVICS
jgi:hypothetical protein